MESDKTPNNTTSKEMEVEVPCGSEIGSELQGFVHVHVHGHGGGLTRQTSMSKTSCLCSPTTHAGSFRCRLHRTTTSLHRTKSIESASASTLPDQPSSTVVDITKDHQVH